MTQKMSRFEDQLTPIGMRFNISVQVVRKFNATLGAFVYPWFCGGGKTYLGSHCFSNVTTPKVKRRWRGKGWGARGT